MTDRESGPPEELQRAISVVSSLEEQLNANDRPVARVRRDKDGLITEIRLYLQDSKVEFGNRLLGNLAALPGLRTLIVFDSEIDDDGLRVVRDFPSLETLVINRAPLTDAGMRHLEHLGGLRRVQFKGTQVTRERALELHATIPQCEFLDSWCCGCMTIEAILSLES